MDPNARPEIALPDGRDAVDVFGETTVDGIWPHLLVPRDGDSAETLATSLHSLASSDVIPVAPDSSSFEDLARALWDARRAQQEAWPAEGWVLDRITARLRANGIAAVWTLQVESDGAAVDALDHLRAEGMRGAVFLSESEAVELALEPGEAHVGTEGFVQPRRHGLLGRREIDVDEYRTACEAVSGELVAAARAEGVEAIWDGDWERRVVLENVQFVARLP
ncbi:DUF6891 domain-containing protein [Microbacterium karelineae]|uniref:DUF6891 domain-containing protein n=1 Tax=Microbacterium karelineae TaxID=2654283 RepID=UPI0012E9E6F2|nr:hypothetical protein [Microbacterium karelineae]